MSASAITSTSLTNHRVSQDMNVNKSEAPQHLVAPTIVSAKWSTDNSPNGDDYHGATVKQCACPFIFFFFFDAQLESIICWILISIIFNISFWFSIYWNLIGVKREVSPTIVRIVDDLQTIIIPINGDAYDGETVKECACHLISFLSFFLFFFFFLIQKASFDKYWQLDKYHFPFVFFDPLFIET